MPSTKKLTTYRASQFKGPRRRKPAVQQLNRDVRERVEREHDMIQKLIHDADVRREMMVATGRRIEPFAVWTDFDRDIHLAHYKPSDLPRWKCIGEYLKFHLLFQVALHDGGFSFTVRVRPDLEAKWKAEGRVIMDRIKRETRKSLERRGLGELPYCYVVEGKTKRGSQTGLHLHGFFLARDRMLAPTFKMAMEEAIAVHPTRSRAAAGIAPKSGPEVVVEDAYDVVDNSERGRGRWASYLAKNACKWDSRLPGQRLYMSQTGKQTARSFWDLLREDPFPEGPSWMDDDQP